MEPLGGRVYPGRITLQLIELGLASRLRRVRAQGPCRLTNFRKGARVGGGKAGAKRQGYQLRDGLSQQAPGRQ